MQPTFFIHRGGGPCFFLDPGPMREAWTELAYLRSFTETLDEQPRAILVISGHWKMCAQPSMLHALAPLREEGVVIVGNGQSYHDMRGVMGGRGPTNPAAQAFDAWLREAMADATCGTVRLLPGRRRPVPGRRSRMRITCRR
jgi:aromatic ring-opening dioxygenase catalytic subunit (LigB family)